jgi:TatD DNase family protein
MDELVDTHCHIQSVGMNEGERTTRELWAKSKLTADEVVTSAVAEGVTKMICVGCELEDSQLAIDFVKDRDQCWASIGIHPHEAQHYAGYQHSEKQVEFARLVHEPKVVAIGECGLDFFYTHSPKADQVAILEFQFELAITKDLPLIFHVREAFDDFWPIFDKYPGARGVLHSFTDSSENLAKAIKRNLFIGVNGIATFAKDPVQLDVYRAVPLEKLLLETDAPFLTPTPYRGTINEPKRLGGIADFLASLRGEDRADLATATTHNARQLFGLGL